MSVKEIDWERVLNNTLYGGVTGLVIGTSVSVIKGITFDNPWVYQQFGKVRKFGPITFTLPFIFSTTTMFATYSLTRELHQKYGNQPARKPHLFCQIVQKEGEENESLLDSIITKVLSKEYNVNLQSRNEEEIERVSNELLSNNYDTLQSEVAAGTITGGLFGLISFRPLHGITLGISISFLNFIFKTTYNNYKDRHVLRSYVVSEINERVSKGEIKQIEANELYSEFGKRIKGVEYYSNSFFQTIDNFLALFYEPLLIYRQVTPEQAENIKAKSTRIKEFEYFKLQKKLEHKFGNNNDNDNNINNEDEIKNGDNESN